MPYQLFDIVKLRPEHGAKVYAIVAVEPLHPTHAYVAVKLDKGPLTKRYRLSDDEILAKIGTLDAAALQLEASHFDHPASENWQLGQHFARYMAQRAPLELDRRRWALLARLEPGAAVTIQRRTRQGVRLEQHRFVEVLPSGQKYHFAAINPNGTVYKWTLESLQLETAEQ